MHRIFIYSPLCNKHVPSKSMQDFKCLLTCHVAEDSIEFVDINDIYDNQITDVFNHNTIFVLNDKHSIVSSEFIKFLNMLSLLIDVTICFYAPPVIDEPIVIDSNAYWRISEKQYHNIRIFAVSEDSYVSYALFRYLDCNESLKTYMIPAVSMPDNEQDYAEFLKNIIR